MFTKILIANRGEIACRIIRTARRMGILTVAVFSDADINALHVSMADEAVHIGPPPPPESYLLGERIIEAAKKTGAQAIHPGYGFLSENGSFCQMCHEHNLVFIGPPAAAIKAMGSKSAAKKIMEEAGVPLVPGYHGEDQNPLVLQKAANEIGYPVLLKAVKGGGGKGMRQVSHDDEFTEALTAARREALNSFGDDTMLVEKFLTGPRHVEIQVFCDQHGNAVYLAERDCSIQRRHQKIIEEAPAPGISEQQREEMGMAAVRAAKAIDYKGAGTVEFLFDSDGSFYFMEMNTRLQVEHPVTEMVTGQDLVEWQLRVASGEKLPLSQEQIRIHGHALEARIYAEDPANEFLPASGTLTFLQPPPESRHIRVDTGVLQGDEVSVYYDPMIAKLVAWDENRDKALGRLTRALSEYRIGGMATNVDFLSTVTSTKEFQQAKFDTTFIEKHFDTIFHKSTKDISRGLILAGLYLTLAQAEQASMTALQSPDPWSPWDNTNGWRLNESHQNHFELLYEEQQYSVTVSHLGARNGDLYRISSGEHVVLASGKIEYGVLLADIDGHKQQVFIDAQNTTLNIFLHNKTFRFGLLQPDLGDEEAGEGPAALTAPMNGTIVAIVASPGATVTKGETLLVMEAMKMEHTIRAPQNGRVMEFYYQVGDLVDGDAELLHFEADTKELQED